MRPRFHLLRGPVRLLVNLSFLSVLLLSPAHPAFADSALTTKPAVRVEYFSPQGYVRSVRQVVVRFSASMVALGDPRLPDPFTVSCPARGKGRWADGIAGDSRYPAGVSTVLRCGSRSAQKSRQREGQQHDDREDRP